MSNKPSNTEIPAIHDKQEEDRHDSEKGESVSQSQLAHTRTSSHVIPIYAEDTSGDEKVETTISTAQSLYTTVTIEDLGDTESPIVTASTSQTGPTLQRISEHGITGAIGNNSNTNMAMLPVSQITGKNSQMIPIALLRKYSNSVSADECSGNAGAGIMQIITGANKVAPAEASCSPESISAAAPPITTVGAVLMMIPKKSDTNTPSADMENNPAVENQTLEQSANINCQSTESNNQPDVVVKPTPSYDSYEEVCRICHDNPSKMELISPCLCKGSMSKVHRACLERWLSESAKNSCEICNYEYNTVRKPKYTGCRSLFQWIRHPLSPSDMRNLFFDIACFFILTPLAAISSWLCVVGAQHYTFGEERRRRAKFRNEASAIWDVHGRPDTRADHPDTTSNATWTSVGLLTLTGTLLVAYSVWLFVAIKYHIQAWREWQQRNYTVTIVPFEDGCMGRPPPPRPPRNQSNNNNNDSILGGSDNGNVYNFDANPNLLRYSGHNSVMRGRGGRNIFRANRQGRRSYNLPPIFNRNHFLRNPPPGYTISETTLLYQALYGSDSDAFLNENFLAFFADSSDDVTESPSQVAPEFLNTVTGSQAHGQSQNSTENPPCTDLAEVKVLKEENTRISTVINMEFPSCSNNANNNQLLNLPGTDTRGNVLTESTQRTENCSPNTPRNDNQLVLYIPCTDDSNENESQQNDQECI